MSKAIRFTKAEMDAVARCIERAKATQAFGGMQTGSAQLMAKVEEKHLQSLYDKMVAAQDDGDKPKLRVAPREFVEALQRHLGDKLVVFDHPSTWIKLYTALKSEPFQSVADVEELGKSMTWVTQPVSVLTVAMKGGEWLARHRAQRAAAPATTGPKKISWD
jgi:hypothetical protein